MCGAGTFSVSGAVSCRNCSAGYACPPGSTSSAPADAICAAGTHSRTGAVSCTACGGGETCCRAGSTQPDGACVERERIAWLELCAALGVACGDPCTSGLSGVLCSDASGALRV
jgi:hypothetical protein